MAKLTVRNVGPIREAELEVKKYTVFIGPQGSGKSTLAKLIAIGGDERLGEPSGQDIDSLLKKFSLNTFIDPSKSNWDFHTQCYDLIYRKGLHFSLTDYGQTILDKQLSLFVEQSADSLQVLPLMNFRSLVKSDNRGPVYSGNAMAQSHHFYKQNLPILIEPTCTLIPTERHLFPLLSDSIWSLLSANINLPESLKAFGLEFEQARNGRNQLTMPFLNIRYTRENGRDLVYHSDSESVILSQSASGYQAVVPLLVSVEYHRQQSQRRFIIEEPELNLYPIAQKDLIYALLGGLQPDIDYKDADWVITTHSPYILSSLNTLMLAYKVAQRSNELRAEVEKIIPERCWINPDEFAAYYVDNGTVCSIISEKTGLIDENELDDASDVLADEQEVLFDLYRATQSSRA